MSGRRSAARPSVRKAAIIEFVERRGRASVDELAEKFDTSPETVRRDLNRLAEAGRLRKVHGGARRIGRIVEGSFEERMAQNALAKQLVAEKVAKIVLPDQSLFIDTGSTTLICAETLAKVRNLTVITNSSRIAAVFSAGPGGADVHMLGGSYRADNAQTVGPATVTHITQFRTKHAILTIGALDNQGATDYSEEEAQVARAMIRGADELIVVADGSKLGHHATFRVCGLEQIDRLVLDKQPNSAMSEALAVANVEVL